MHPLVAYLVLAVGPGEIGLDWNPWYSDYGVALQQARAAGKPLLVVLDSPAQSAAQLKPVSNAESDDAALLAHYVLCRVDVSTRYGQAVAAAFQATSFPHLAIIDRAGRYKVYKYTGQMTREQWHATLAYYRNGQGGGASTVSFSQPAAQPYVCRT
jgi:hypothetical protein